MNAVDDKPHADADAEGGTPANLDIVATDHNRFLLDGSLGDLVLMYTAAPSAPHVVRNLRGDLVFGQGVASACIYEKDAGSAIRDRIQLALAKYALKQLLVEATPCGFDGAPSDAQENLYVTASGMFSVDYLQRCIGIVGIDRILFSTDFPYQYRPGREARRFLEDAPLDEAAKAKVAHGNWDRLTGAG